MRGDVSNDPASEPKVENITVTDCTFMHGHGVSIGSETNAGVRNFLVQKCTFENTDNGLRIKSDRGRGGVVENVQPDQTNQKVLMFHSRH